MGIGGVGVRKEGKSRMRARLRDGIWIGSVGMAVRGGLRALRERSGEH